MENVRDAIFVIDDERRILFANAAAARQFGGDRTGLSFVRVVRNPAVLEAIEAVLSGAATRKVQFVQEGQYRIFYDVTIAAIADAAGNPTRAMVGLADISHIHEAEQMRSDFVANVSHELRSPLTSLAGFIETLRGPARDDPAASERFLSLMETEAQRMVRLIQDLLSLSKVEANQRIRPEDEVDVVSVVRRLLRTLAGLAEREGKALKLDATTEVAPVTGSDDELTQVFQNLIENAIKYGRADSTVTVRIDWLDKAMGMSGPAVSVTVIDQGEGIPREHIPRLTERFYRVDTHRSRDKGGTGLGLAIVKHIIGRHRGRLQIESEANIGSRFRVLLPARPKAQA
ncbi:MAG: PAS domain-containing protein [Nitratireductor sp.]|nr:PAS domain-containing protein [Nitratireductor sp.]